MGISILPQGLPSVTHQLLKVTGGCTGGLLHTHTHTVWLTSHSTSALHSNGIGCLPLLANCLKIASELFVLLVYCLQLFTIALLLILPLHVTQLHAPPKEYILAAQCTHTHTRTHTHTHSPTHTQSRTHLPMYIVV